PLARLSCPTRRSSDLLVAKHGWGVQKDHVWRAADFDKSWKALKSTDFYGVPGDGIIPSDAAAREPALLDLPSFGTGRAGIERSLDRKSTRLNSSHVKI